MYECHCEHCKLDTIITQLSKQETMLMGLQEDFAGLRANLTEATTEITAKLDELVAQVEAGKVDPALVDEVKALSQGLADIVPDVEPPA